VSALTQIKSVKGHYETKVEGEALVARYSARSSK
jgi:hypothetical protein